MWIFIGISVFLWLIYTVLIMKYRHGWRIALSHSSNLIHASTFYTRVSVIVPARNEASTIEACAFSLLHQNYPEHLLEIIIVNDASEDETALKVCNLAAIHPRLKLINLSAVIDSRSHKKRAIEAGIQAARGTLIVCTDADCNHPTAWISQLVASHQGGGYHFVAAPVVYKTQPNLLSIFQTLDFMTLQGITAASVATNMHTMCNGANIAYSKTAFEKVEGFKGIDKIPTGDDMLLMYKIYGAYPLGINYLLHKQATVETIPPITWKGFLQQRIRWASKAAFYDDKRIFRILLLVYLFNAWLFCMPFVALFIPQFWMVWLLMLVLKTIAELIFLLPVAKFFNKLEWMWYFPLLQPLHIAYTVLAGWLGRFGSYQWKGRTIKHQ